MIKYFIINLLLISFPLNGVNIQACLANIPSQSREELNSLFSTILGRDQGAYTLFGDKPISLSGDFILTPS
jgi:hypothetical protein